jgi:hypothetical protein
MMLEVRGLGIEGFFTMKRKKSYVLGSTKIGCFVN